MRTSLLAAAAVTLLLSAQQPAREFDFWIGEWSVQNRHMNAEGVWGDGDRTRARITPVCSGAAVLEEWAGPLHGKFMNGFSLRAFDPELQRWRLLLFWTTDGNSNFGQLQGSFRHGRGEFFAPLTGMQRTRYTFSDGLPNSVRWDSARTSDGGVTWKTDWIMEFSRTRPAAQVTQDRLFDVAWTEGRLSPHPEARQLDWMLGSWSGEQVDERDQVREARLRCKTLDKDCLILDLLETRPEAGADWEERLAVRGFEAGPRRWTSWSLSEMDPRLRSSELQLLDGGALFVEQARADGSHREELWSLDAEDQLTIEHSRVTPGANGDEVELIDTTRLRRGL